MEDFIDEMFAAVDAYYPGSKRKRITKVDAPVVKVVEWDSRPYTKTLPNGQDVEFFTIGALAQALGRPVITIRHWITNGYIPTSTYKMPSVTDKNGDARQGRWLYTRAMIETAVELFDKNGLLDLNRIEWSSKKKVSQELSETWSNLRFTENT